MMSNLCFSLVLFIAFSPISHPNHFLLLVCFLSLSSSRHVFFMCLVLAFVDTSNKGNSTLSWIQTLVTYTELKYYQILLLCSSKSFLFSTYVLVSPWRGRRWCRLWTHKFRKQQKNEGEIIHLWEDWIEIPLFHTALWYGTCLLSLIWVPDSGPLRISSSWRYS